MNNKLMKKGLLLYVGYWGYYGGRYYTPTDDELKKMLSATDEILLIPISEYNRYTDENGNEVRILSHEIIDNMTVDMVGDPARFDIIKSEYHATAENRIAADYHVQDYISDAKSLAERIVAIKPDAKLWFSVPPAECFHALTYLFADPWCKTVDDIKSALSEDIWNNNVQGIYYAGEDIVTSGYTKFDYSAPERDFDNPIVYAMHKVSDKVHSYGKNLLWIPYYHEAAPSSTNLGYVANLTDIFDTVIIQPSFFFNSARTEEIGIISKSVKAQAVLDINGEIIGGKKISKTVIGFEMEIDSQYFDQPDYAERYNAYETGFGDLVGTYPTAYYAGPPETMLRCSDIISKFLSKNG